MSQKEMNNIGEDEDMQMPLGVGGDGAPAEEYSEPRKTRVNTSTLALVAAFAAALIVLYLLGLQNKPRSSTAADLAHAAELDDRFAKALSTAGDKKIKNLFSDTRGLVEIMKNYFNYKTTAEDVPNPFEGVVTQVVKGPDKGTEPQIHIVSGMSPAEMAAARELEQAAQDFLSLKLKMTMMGQSPQALINDGAKDRLMQPGNKIKLLTVDEIFPDKVILKYLDKKYELTSKQDK